MIDRIADDVERLRKEWQRLERAGSPARRQAFLTYMAARDLTGEASDD